MGLPAEHESVVKDLWALRLQLLKDRSLLHSDGDMVFSSQPQTENDTESNNKNTRGTNLLANVVPGIIETLGLCYLGAVLLRLPVSIQDLHRYLNLFRSSGH